MFFIFSKILSFLTTPLVWVISVLVFALVQKNKAKRNWLLMLTVVFFYIFANGYIVKKVYQYWEPEPMYFSQIKQNQYDIVVVMGGYINTKLNTKDRINTFGCTDRLYHAVDLYLAKKTKKILVSGGNGHIYGGKNSEADLSCKLLLKMGVPQKDIIIENQSKNTYQNVLFSLPLIKKSDKVLIVTSYCHLHRSSLCFQKQGIKVDLFGTCPMYDHLSKFEWTDLFPNLENLVTWESVMHEWIGIFTYFCMDYI